MKLKIDSEGDALDPRLDEREIVESEEVEPGVVLDFDAQGRMVGLEILRLSTRMDPDRPRTIQFETA